MTRIASIAALYAHAIAIEREAAERYAQEHVQLIERMLESTPDRLVHWEDLHEA
jgi:hypothetical protein